MDVFNKSHETRWRKREPVASMLPGRCLDSSGYEQAYRKRRKEIEKMGFGRQLDRLELDIQTGTLHKYDLSPTRDERRTTSHCCRMHQFTRRAHLSFIFQQRLIKSRDGFVKGVRRARARCTLRDRQLPSPSLSVESISGFQLNGQEQDIS